MAEEKKFMLQLDEIKDKIFRLVQDTSNLQKLFI